MSNGVQNSNGANTIINLAGLDIGNGYVKALIGPAGQPPEGVRFISSAAVVTNPHEIKTGDSEIPSVMNDLYDEADVTFESPLIKDHSRRLLGRRGVQSGFSLEEFDVYSHLSKAQQDLSAVLVLGTLACKALRDFWNVSHVLPKEMLRVEFRIGLALPISEYKKYRRQYAMGFLNSTHIITFHNFETDVRIEIKISDVQCVAEGAAAQFAINSEGEPLLNAMLNDLKRLGNNVQNITAADVLSAKNTVSVDVGEGTVNFPVFQNGKFNPDASMTLEKGYGTVLTRSLDRLSDEGLPFNNRKELADFLQATPSAINRARYEKVKRIVDEEVNGFANEVKMSLVKILSRVGSYVEVVYVYGGGATPMKDVLHKILIETSKSFGGADVSYPVLYLDSRWSQYLNRKGLYVITNLAYDATQRGQG